MLAIIKIGVLVSSMTIFAASAAEWDKVFSLINQRLSYMQEVAVNKAKAHLAIEDLEQEKKVLQKAMVTAKNKGLDPDSVKPLFSALMETAKIIQYRYQRNHLNTAQKAGDLPVKTLAKIRLEIAKSSDLLIEALYQILHSGVGFDETSREKLIKIIDQPELSNIDKELIFTALRAVKLKQ